MSDPFRQIFIDAGINENNFQSFKDNLVDVNQQITDAITIAASKVDLASALVLRIVLR